MSSMGTLSLQYAVGFAVTSFAGVLMLKYGSARRVLERRTHRCRVCGGVPRRNCTCDLD
jgi:hypothetical protein